MTPDRTSPARPTGRTRSAVLGFLRLRPGSTPGVIATEVQLPRETVKKALQRLAADGEVTTAGRGHYYLARRRHLSPVPPPGDTPGTAGTEFAAPAGDTRAEPDVPPPAHDAVTQPGDSASPTSWVCPDCYWRQAVGSVGSCEHCGRPRARGGLR